MVVVPTAVVCTAATAGATFCSTRFFPDRGRAARSSEDDIAESEGL
jgi:hypothetical protein